MNERHNFPKLKCINLSESYRFKGRDLKAISFASNKLASNGVKVHLFKGTSYNLISKVPIHSCDSISWTIYAFTGCLLYWNPYRSKQDKTDLIAFEDKLGQKRSGRVYFEDYQFKPQLEEYLYRKLRITFNDLLSSRHQFYREIVNILYYTEIEGIINRTD